jgi:hypothetical protein
MKGREGKGYKRGWNKEKKKKDMNIRPNNQL